MYDKLMEIIDTVFVFYNLYNRDYCCNTVRISYYPLFFCI